MYGEKDTQDHTHVKKGKSLVTYTRTFNKNYNPEFTFIFIAYADFYAIINIHINK